MGYSGDGGSPGGIVAAGGGPGRWDAVPEELKRQPRWVCWRRVVREGRATKMPVCAATGKMAKSTDASTWCSFADAVASVGRAGADGVGFVFGPDRAYTGLDLDHVLHDGVLEEQYRWVVDAAGTYTEVSPSGDGLHLYFRGSKPGGAERCRRGPVEMYDHDRFFTVTGTPWTGVREVACRPEVVERAYRAWIEPVAETRQLGLADAAAGAADVAHSGATYANSDNSGEMTDEELLERMLGSRNGAEIRSLMDGDLSAHGGDHSAADMALCNRLAFWCGGDVVRMDRFFRNSGLMRDKWDKRRGSETYGAQTLRRAVENATDFYKPRRRGKRTVARSGGKQGGNGKATAATDTYKCSTNEGPSPREGYAQRAPEFDPGHAPTFGRWVVDGEGALHCRAEDGKSSWMVCGTAPWVAIDLHDRDDGRVRALVRVSVPGGVRELSMERDDLLNANRIVGALAPLGAAVSTVNAKDVVRYLTECENVFGRVRPRCQSTRHLGWADKPLGAFVPYDAGEVRFDPTADQALKARPFMEAAGTLAEWVAGVGAIRAKSPAFRLVIAASFASPLVAVLGVQSFIVYLWGRSRSGKTPTLKAAGSVWGDPSEGPDGYFRTFADTPKAIVREATLLHDVPVIVDELQSKGSSVAGQGGKRMAVEDLLYSLSLGQERAALNSDRSMMRTGSWKSLAIATGEIPVVGDSTMTGAANRTVELNAEPFADQAEAQAMHQLVATQYGTAGRAYIEALKTNPRETYVDQFARMRAAVDAVAGGHPQAGNLALLAFADVLAAFYVFSPGMRGWDECFDSGVELARWGLEHVTGGESDTDVKAIQRVAEFFAESFIHFDEGCEMDRLARWGILEEKGGGRLWCVIPSVLDQDLSAHGFDKQKTLRRMDDEGLLVRGNKKGRGFGKQKRIGSGGNRVYCICVDGVAMERFLQRANGDAEDVVGGAVAVGSGAGVAAAPVEAPAAAAAPVAAALPGFEDFGADGASAGVTSGYAGDAYA